MGSFLGFVSSVLGPRCSTVTRPVVGLQHAVRPQQATRSARLGGVLERQEIAPRAVCAEHRRDQLGGSRPRRRGGGQLINLLPYVDHRTRHGAGETLGVDVVDSGLDRRGPGGAGPQLRRRCLQRGEVDAVALGAQLLGADRVRRSEQRGEHPLRDLIDRLRVVAHRCHVVADERRLGGHPPDRSMRSGARFACVALKFFDGLGSAAVSPASTCCRAWLTSGRLASSSRFADSPDNATQMPAPTTASRAMAIPRSHHRRRPCFLLCFLGSLASPPSLGGGGARAGPPAVFVVRAAGFLYRSRVLAGLDGGRCDCNRRHGRGSGALAL